MSDKLQQIQKSIAETQERITDLQEEVKAVTISLKKKQAEQESVILEGQETKKIDSEISGLRVKIAGTHSALETLSSRLETLRTEEQSEKIAIAKAKIEDAYDQVTTQGQEVYRSLLNVVDEVNKLSEKIAVVKQLARQAKIADPSSMTSLLNMLSSTKAQINRWLIDLISFRPE
jgi:chromosome segregation ATPase